MNRRCMFACHLEHYKNIGCWGNGLIQYILWGSHIQALIKNLEERTTQNPSCQLFHLKLFLKHQ